MKNLAIRNESERLTMANIVEAATNHNTSFDNFSYEAKDIMAREMHSIITNGLTQEHISAFMKAAPIIDIPMNLQMSGDNTGALLFQEIVGGMCETYISKNHDYGNSFDKSLDEDGLVASKVRIGDKFNRFGNLIRKENKVSDESMEDTLLDMANYAIMTVMWMRCQKS